MVSLYYPRTLLYIIVIVPPIEFFSLWYIPPGMPLLLLIHHLTYSHVKKEKHISYFHQSNFCLGWHLLVISSIYLYLHWWWRYSHFLLGGTNFLSSWRLNTSYTCRGFQTTHDTCLGVLHKTLLHQQNLHLQQIWY